MHLRRNAAVALVTLLVAGCGGSAGDPAPSVSSFASTPGSIVLGSSATLAWQVTNATSISIDQGIGLVAGESAVVVPGATTTYTLTATGTGGTATSTTTLVVTPPSTVLDVACAGASCGAASPYFYSGSGVGIWRFHNGEAGPRTIDVHVGGVTVGDEAVLVFSNGTGLGISPVPSAGSLPFAAPVALRLEVPDAHEALDRARDTWHRDLLEENRAIGRSLRAAAGNGGTRRPAGAHAASVLATPVVGDRRSWYESLDSMEYYDTVALAVCDLPGGRRAVFWVDPNSTASGSLLPEDLGYFQATFCAASSSDVGDGYGRVTALLGDVWGPVSPDVAGLLISDAPALQDVNVVFLEVPGALEDKIWAGYFWGGNNVLRSFGSWYADSNEALVFFLDATQVHVDPRARSYIGSSLLHELTHMVDLYQREVTRDAQDDTWLTETVALMTEDIVTPVATPDHYSTTADQRVPRYIRSGGAISLTGWFFPAQDPYALAGSLGAFLNRRYGTAIVSGTVECEGGSLECLDGLIRAGGGIGFADEFERMGASIFGLLPATGTPEGYGYPEKVSGGYTLAPIDVAAFASRRKATATALGEDFAATSHTYQVDTVPVGRGVYSRTGIVVPGGTSLHLVIQGGRR